MTLASHQNILSLSQSRLVALISADATLSAITTNILDGIPTSLYRGTGFPYIIVHTPTIRCDRYTQTKMRVMIAFNIEVYDKKEGNVRKLGDAIRNLLYTQQSALRENRFTNMTIKSTSISREFLPDESSTPVWKYTVSPEFRWCGT